MDEKLHREAADFLLRELKQRAERFVIVTQPERKPKFLVGLKRNLEPVWSFEYRFAQRLSEADVDARVSELTGRGLDVTAYKTQT